MRKKTGPNGLIGKLKVLAIAMALAPVACGGGDDPVGAAEPESAAEVEGGPPPLAASLTGNYLAGRHAQSRRDVPNATRFLNAALEMDPENGGLLRRTFVMLVMEGRLDDAKALADRILAQDDDMLAALLLVIDHIKAGRYAEADAQISELPRTGLQALVIPLVRAWILVGLERVDDAIEEIAELKKRKLTALHDMHVGLISDLAGRNGEADRRYKGAIKDANRLSLRLTELYGAFLERSGRWDEARELYEDYIQGNPRSTFLAPALERVSVQQPPEREVASPGDGVAEGLFDIASLLSQRDNMVSALAFGRMALFLRPEFTMMRIRVADVLETDGQLAAANDIYADIDPASPLSWTARLRIAANLNALDKTDEALDLLRDMAEQKPDRAEAMLEIAEILRMRDRYDEAVEAYDEAIERIGELRPEHWDILYSRGMALEQSDQWDRAEADFLRALEFQPDDPYVLNYLGYSWVEQGRNIAWAEEMIRTAVQKKPKDGYIVDSLGWVYYRLGRFDEATRELERAVFLRPQDPVINDHLGDAYWKVGRRHEARFQWRRVLSLDPEPDLVPKVERKLRQGLVGEATEEK